MAFGHGLGGLQGHAWPAAVVSVQVVSQ